MLELLACNALSHAEWRQQAVDQLQLSAATFDRRRRKLVEDKWTQANGVPVVVDVPKPLPMIPGHPTKPRQAGKAPKAIPSPS